MHASPSVRRLARELEVDLTTVKGTGEKGRITKDDVKAFLRGPAPAPAAARAGGRHGHPRDPGGRTSRSSGRSRPSRCRASRSISGPHLHRAWLNVPHVTHSDEADITEIDAYRKELDTAAKDEGLPRHAAGLPDEGVGLGAAAFPEFNSLADARRRTPDPQEVLQHRHRGRHAGRAGGAGDQGCRPQGHHRAQPGAGRDLGEGARRQARRRPTCRARTFTISSLGGIGGTAFTPIVNAPEVAILGVVRSKMAPVWNGEEFEPRLMLPLSLSYDHRVIDGALAARFARHLCPCWRMCAGWSCDGQADALDPMPETMR